MVVWKPGVDTVIGVIAESTDVLRLHYKVVGESSFVENAVGFVNKVDKEWEATMNLSAGVYVVRVRNETTGIDKFLKVDVADRAGEMADAVWNKEM